MAKRRNNGNNSAAKRAKRGGSKPRAFGANAVRVRGRSLVSLASSTNSTGLFVLDSFDIDSTFLTSLGTISNAFEKWRVNRLKFTWVPNCPTSFKGTIYFACLDDPNESSPTSPDTILNCRVACCTTCYQRASMTFVPLNKSRWLYTRDQVTSDDRWEMPGVFLAATGSFDSTQSPGRFLVEYDVEFQGVTNSSVQMTKDQSDDFEVLPP